MIQLLNLPMSSAYLRDYGGVDGLRRELVELNCHGIEGIWAGEETVFPAELVPGYHLTFYPDWLDFYHENKTALLAAQSRGGHRHRSRNREPPAGRRNGRL